MFKVAIKYHYGLSIIIHVFKSEPEARAYILGVREWAQTIGDLQITLNGHRVNGADPKQRGG